jgi:hypothetical protein
VRIFFFGIEMKNLDALFPSFLIVNTALNG